MPSNGGIPAAAIADARKNVEEVLSRCLEHGPDAGSVIVFDQDSPLARLLAQAYLEALPRAAALDFGRTAPDEILKRLGGLRPGDLVVLIESSSFRLARHRLRMDLFRAGRKVIEHPHLARMREEEIPVYLDALAYDEEQYGRVAPALKERIDRAHEARLVGNGEELVYDSEFETARLNTGDYRGTVNVGGQFPIGEVFTEPRHIERVNGCIEIFAFGDAEFTVNAPARPFAIVVEKGILTNSPDAPPEFSAVLEQIRAEEGRVWLRELGFGLNRAMSRGRRVSEIGTFERMCGIHLSLGAKHAIYAKPGFPKKSSKFHVDVFPAVDRVEIDGEMVFEGGSYLL